MASAISWDLSAAHSIKVDFIVNDLSLGFAFGTETNVTSHANSTTSTISMDENRKIIRYVKVRVHLDEKKEFI